MIRNRIRKNFKPITFETSQNLKGELVGVHYNSHEKCWSVVSFKSRKTVAKLAGHTETLILTDISFKVDMSKKKKALEKGKKDRHTFIVGVFGGVNSEYLTCSNEKLFYHVDDNINPFKDSKGNTVTGKNAYFTKDGKVLLI